ncbi:hypothetical protein A2W24_05615 [Microgenomates group bacterium RBG_16_45_19]|nr:MAG: hypothetical protein A2W24_05615 [Microgenomates group bacterium RBG_16_45_19]
MNPHSKPSVSVIVVNYNGDKFLTLLLSSITKQKYRDFEVVIVDNASVDQSISRLKLWLKQNPLMAKKVKIIKEKRNWGFARGNNIGVAQANGKYLLFINTDTELEPEALGHMVTMIQGNMFTAGVAPKIYLSRFLPQKVFDSVGICINDNASPYNRAIGQIDLGQYDKPELIMGLCFACCLVRKDIYTLLGGLDNTYFAYFEDVDFSLRVLKTGYRFYACPKALVYHYHSGTSSSRAYAWKYHLIFRNYLRTVVKSMGKRTAIRVVSHKTKDFLKTVIDRETPRLMRQKLVMVLIRFYLIDWWVYSLKRNQVHKSFNRTISDDKVFKFCRNEPSNFFDPVALKPDIGLKMLDFIIGRLNRSKLNQSHLEDWLELKRIYYCDPTGKQWQKRWQEFAKQTLGVYGQQAWVQDLLRRG